MKQAASAVLIFALLCGCVTRDDVQTPVPDALVAGWKGQKACELLQEKPSYRVLRCTFPPGAGHERHYHPPHFGFALSGGKAELIDASGTREAVIATGSSFTSNGTAWHEMRNIGESVIAYIIVEEKGAAAPGR
ncbi:cupin domain-containing protein [Altererythrobacter sp. GH1-8]|uniref:cupin domain-containing protein n=1 Tax=Altererythrobacter sp. GH1-8 TaxID=3349333 RepID=UPI00374D10E8